MKLHHSLHPFHFNPPGPTIIPQLIGAPAHNHLPIAPNPRNDCIVCTHSYDMIPRYHSPLTPHTPPHAIPPTPPPPPSPSKYTYHPPPPPPSPPPTQTKKINNPTQPT